MILVQNREVDQVNGTFASKHDDILSVQHMKASLNDWGDFRCGQLGIFI